MIAEWTVEIGPGSPVIELPWEGWVDLRSTAPAAVRGLAEVRAHPELEALLQAANTGNTSTAKVDVFPVSREEVAPEIAEAGAEQTAFGLGSYLDVVLTPVDALKGFPAFERAARTAAATLRDEGPLLAYAEIVLRAARLYDRETLGWTLYAVGFGPDAQAARGTWTAAAAALVRSFTEAVAKVIASSGTYVGE